MALSNDTITYLSVRDGFFVQRVPADARGAVPRKTNTGQTVYEWHYNKISGYLEGIRRDLNEYGKYWLFMIRDGHELYQLRLPYQGLLAEGIIMRLPNVDLGRPIDFKIFKNAGGNVVTYLRQGDDTVPKYWNKENNYLDLPPLQDIVRQNGQPGKDGTRRMEYLERWLLKDERLQKLIR